jgi:hypothetical protein
MLTECRYDECRSVEHRIKSVEQRALKNVNNCLNNNIYPYLETSGGQSSILYLNVVHFFNAIANQTSVAA